MGQPVFLAVIDAAEVAVERIHGLEVVGGFLDGVHGGEGAGPKADCVALVKIEMHGVNHGLSFLPWRRWRGGGGAGGACRRRRVLPVFPVFKFLEHLVDHGAQQVAADRDVEVFPVVRKELAGDGAGVDAEFGAGFLEQVHVVEHVIARGGAAEGVGAGGVAGDGIAGPELVLERFGIQREDIAFVVDVVADVLGHGCFVRVH